jgi:hypothetical protein
MGGCKTMPKKLGVYSDSNSAFWEIKQLESASFDKLEPKELIGVPMWFKNNDKIEFWPKPSAEIKIYELVEINLSMLPTTVLKLLDQ